jgi:hypothetical protein
MAGRNTTHYRSGLRVCCERALKKALANGIHTGGQCGAADLRETARMGGSWGVSTSTHPVAIWRRGVSPLLPAGKALAATGCVVRRAACGLAARSSLLAALTAS